jgi:hypothetical protein
MAQAPNECIAPMPHAQGKISIKHSSWSNHQESARHHLRQPLSSSASCPAECPPFRSLLITAIELSVHGLGTGAGHYIRGLMSGRRTQAAPCLPTFPSFPDSSIHEGRVCPDDDCGLPHSGFLIAPTLSVPCPLFAGSVLRPVPVVSYAHRAIREPSCLTAARALRLGARFGRAEDI